jgi:hypothetical protein
MTKTVSHRPSILVFIAGLRSLGYRVASFRQINKAQSNLHRDALELPNGEIVLLTHLCKGQRATVLQLPTSAPVKVEVKQPQGAFIV